METAPTSIEVLFTSNSRSVRRAIWFTWFSEPHECIQHLAVPCGHPSNYEPVATLLNFSDRADTDEQTPYSVYCFNAAPTWFTRLFSQICMACVTSSCIPGSAKKHEGFTQCRFNAGPPSATNIERTSRAATNVLVTVVLLNYLYVAILIYPHGFSANCTCYSFISL